VSLTYTRDAGGPAELSAALVGWVGRADAGRTQAEPGAARLDAERDYVFPVAALVLGGAAVTPRKGDRVTEVIAGTPTTFEVVPPTADEREWRYSDQTRTAYRVHTKRV
jgi:hypothetical protein